MFGKRFAPEYLIVECRHYHAHQRRQQVEEAIRQVREGRHAKHGALRHAASVPGHQHGGYGNGVLGGSAEQSALIALIVVHVAKHVAREQDTQVLVGDGHIEHQARGGGASPERGAALYEMDKQSGNAAHHARGRHGSAEAHGADDEPDGVHHAAHAACGDERCEHVAVGVERGASTQALHGGAEE